MLKSNENFKGLTTESLIAVKWLGPDSALYKLKFYQDQPAATEEALEGYYLLGADFIRSFGGPLQALAFTPVILPVYEDINDQFGQTGHVNVAAKLYALLYDTDLDILYFTPAFTVIAAMNDWSFNLTPELDYSPITNLELRLRGIIPVGGALTEYGEKQSDWRVEFRLRYFF